MPLKPLSCKRQQSDCMEGIFVKRKSISDYVFSYNAIGFSGINYYVQKVSNRLPFLLNKLLAIIFFLLLFFQLFLLAVVY